MSFFRNQNRSSSAMRIGDCTVLMEALSLVLVSCLLVGVVAADGTGNVLFLLHMVSMMP